MAWDIQGDGTVQLDAIVPEDATATVVLPD
ncbi:MAG: hypothetical protein IKC28_03965 [Clostridia bacterium]|nr:hypothetical protein [Clostridia bacterium]